MKVAITLTQIPFIAGGAELHAAMLRDELKKRDYQADIVTIPFKWYPTTTLLDCMVAGRMMDLSEVNGERIDRVISLKFPTYYCKHHYKVLWLEHQHRQAYDLWNTSYGDLHMLPDGEYVRAMITEHDKKYISEAKAVYTIAQNTSKRLLEYNNIQSETLYHPPLGYEKMYCENYGDYVFYASRIDSVKRQRLLVEAARYLTTGAKIVLAGRGSEPEIEYIHQLIKQHNLENRVVLAGFISEEEKLDYYANCLCVYFGAYDEDYGYITLEAFFSEKPAIVHTDSGGPLEFVEDDVSGYVVAPDARAIAQKIDLLFEDRKLARKLGKAGRESLSDKHMDWDYVIEKLMD